MDSVSLALLGSMVAVLIAALGTLVEVYSIRAIDRRLQREHDYIESRGTIGQQFGKYLQEREKPDEPIGPENTTRLQAWSAIIGRSMFQSLRMSNLQALSVDAKKQGKYDDLVGDAVKDKAPANLKIYQKALDWLGIDLDIMDIAAEGDLPLLGNSLQKFGGGNMLQDVIGKPNNGNSH